VAPLLFSSLVPYPPILLAYLNHSIRRDQLNLWKEKSESPSPSPMNNNNNNKKECAGAGVSGVGTGGNGGGVPGVDASQTERGLDCGQEREVETTSAAAAAAVAVASPPAPTLATPIVPPVPEAMDGGPEELGPKKGLVSPENGANALSWITLWWLNGIYRKGYKRQIEEEDLYLVLDKNRSQVLSSQLNHQWQLERKRASASKKNQTPSLVRVTFKTFWGRYYSSMIGLEFGGMRTRIPDNCLAALFPDAHRVSPLKVLLNQGKKISFVNL